MHKIGRDHVGFCEGRLGSGSSHKDCLSTISTTSCQSNVSNSEASKMDDSGSQTASRFMSGQMATLEDNSVMDSLVTGMYSHKHTYVHAHMHSHIHACVCTYLHTYIHIICTCINIYVHMYIYVSTCITTTKQCIIFTSIKCKHARYIVWSWERGKGLHR